MSANRLHAGSTDAASRGRLRLGLCCLFNGEPAAKFRTTTAAVLSRMPAEDRRERLLDLGHANFLALAETIQACRRVGIHALRVMSGLLPLATHPEHTYGLHDLRRETLEIVRETFWQARMAEIRLSFHPDQFVVLNSPTASVTQSSVRELEMHADLAEALGADVITIHGGGGYGDKPAALRRLAETLGRLPDRIRARLTLENDDKVFHVEDLLPVCRELRIPLTYDVHHHRCLADGLSVGAATEQALRTWNREPLFHISSPRDGWQSSQPWRHADFVRASDFPAEWRSLHVTVDVEAKAKERAVLRLRKALARTAEGAAK